MSVLLVAKVRVALLVWGRHCWRVLLVTVVVGLPFWSPAVPPLSWFTSSTSACSVWFGRGAVVSAPLEQAVIVSSMSTVVRVTGNAFLAVAGDFDTEAAAGGTG